jgi:hypothetical protein
MFEGLKDVATAQDISGVNKPECLIVCCGWKANRIETLVTPGHRFADILEPANP